MHNRKRIPPLDLLCLAFLAAIVGFICHRLFYTLNYRWNWPVIWTYLVRYDPEKGRYAANILLDGFIVTIKLSIWGTLLAISGGGIIGLMRVSPRLFFRLIGRTYVELIRNTPPLVLIFIFYFFISDQLLNTLGVEDWARNSPELARRILAFFGAQPSLITPFLSGVFTLALFQGAYIAEIVRAGIGAIDPGQWEAGKSLGLGRWQTLRLIILPQAVRIMLPPLANEFINTIKWSSIVSIISIQELTFQGLQVMASTQASIEVWITIAVMYLLLCLSLSLVVRGFELSFKKTGGQSASPSNSRFST